MFGGNYEDGLQARPSPTAKWQLKETIRNIHNKFQNFPNSWNPRLKKKNYQKTPATQQKKNMSPVTVLLEFFVHLPQLGVIPNSPAPRLEGTTCRKVDVTGGEDPKRVSVVDERIQNMFLPGKFKKELMNFDSKSQNIKKQKHGCSNE